MNWLKFGIPTGVGAIVASEYAQTTDMYKKTTAGEDAKAVASRQKIYRYLAGAGGAVAGALLARAAFGSGAGSVPKT